MLSPVAKTKVGNKSKISPPVTQTKKIQKKPTKTAVAITEKKPIEEQSNPRENTQIQENAIAEVVKEVSFSEMLLYAQAIDNGFQLVDPTPKIILKIYNTLQPNYYDATIDKKFGAVFVKNNQWVFEYFTEGKLITEPLNIKFCNEVVAF